MSKAKILRRYRGRLPFKLYQKNQPETSPGGAVWKTWVDEENNIEYVQCCDLRAKEYERWWVRDA